MKKYELVVILDAHLSQDEKEKVIKAAADGIAKGEGKVINSQVWLEKHKFTFKIKNRTEGTYYLINFESKQASVIKIHKILSANEDILRFVITNVESKSSGESKSNAESK
ncbi:MAG: 30S ribosomal protein S6 [Candidatus Omnitrophica bacterium]|nr:30S ribosomal protein S6 [Candidatus Omnitrophota bacterium]